MKNQKDYVIPITIKREEYVYKGRRVVLDTSMLAPNAYETMLYRASDYMEIACMTAKTETESLEQYNKILSEHPADKKPAPLAGKYAKLRDDLVKALETGRAAEDADPEDDGTCNLDAASLALPHWSVKMVKQAAKEAGTSCFVWKLFDSRQFVFLPNTRSQGSARSRNAKTMTAALRSMGYDAMDYCQMD